MDFSTIQGNSPTLPPGRAEIRRSGFNPTPSAIPPGFMPYAHPVLHLHFHCQRFGRRHRSAMSRAVRLPGVSLAFGLVFAYVTIVTGRWLFGRKEM